jgi:hypothetical protein
MKEKVVQFNISASEVKQLSRQKMSGKQVNDILTAVENDSVLWNDIESSILGAINMVKEKQNEQRV